MSEPQIQIAVFGPGDEIYTWWGHVSLIVSFPDSPAELPRSYDWGIFSYPGNNFLKAYFAGQVRYKCARGNALADIEGNILEDRDVTLYTLDFSGAGIDTVVALGEENALPENSYYDYDFIQDNCATRIRDLIDVGAGGAFRSGLEAVPGRYTLRQHVRRFTGRNPFSDWFVGNLLPGRDLDRPASPWDEMFLPDEIGRNLSAFVYETGRPLVSFVEVVHKSESRTPPLDAPTNPLLGPLAAGLIAAVILLGLCRWKNRRAQSALTAANCALALFFGLSGALLFLAAYVIPHPAPFPNPFRHNLNLLYVNPLVLFACASWGQKVWRAVCGLTVIALVLSLIPAFHQEIAPVAALILPPALVLSCRKAHNLVL